MLDHGTVSSAAAHAPVPSREPCPRVRRVHQHRLAAFVVHVTRDPLVLLPPDARGRGLCCRGLTHRPSVRDWGARLAAAAGVRSPTGLQPLCNRPTLFPTAFPTASHRLGRRARDLRRCAPPLRTPGMPRPLTAPAPPSQSNRLPPCRSPPQCWSSPAPSGTATTSAKRT